MTAATTNMSVWPRCILWVHPYILCHVLVHTMCSCVCMCQMWNEFELWINFLSSSSSQLFAFAFAPATEKRNIFLHRRRLRFSVGFSIHSFHAQTCVDKTCFSAERNCFYFSSLLCGDRIFAKIVIATTSYTFYDEIALLCSDNLIGLMTCASHLKHKRCEDEIARMVVVVMVFVEYFPVSEHTETISECVLLLFNFPAIITTTTTTTLRVAQGLQTHNRYDDDQYWLCRRSECKRIADGVWPSMAMRFDWKCIMFIAPKWIAYNWIRLHWWTLMGWQKAFNNIQFLVNFVFTLTLSSHEQRTCPSNYRYSNSTPHRFPATQFQSFWN